jgi:hypothetical protein
MGTSAASLLGGLAGNIYTSPSAAGQNPVATEIAGLRQRQVVGPWDWADAANRAQKVQAPQFYTSGEQARGAMVSGMPQTGAAIRGAQQAYGQQAGQDLLTLIDSPEYQAMSPEQRAQAITTTVGASRSEAKYGAESNLALPPDQQVAHQMMEVPRYRGVFGTPDQIAQQNQEIQAARDALAKLSTNYGRRMAEQILMRQSPQAYFQATRSKPTRPDTLWLQEQGIRADLGAPEQPSDIAIPTQGPGQAIVPSQGLGINRLALPPSARGRLR